MKRKAPEGKQQPTQQHYQFRSGWWAGTPICPPSHLPAPQPRSKGWGKERSGNKYVAKNSQTYGPPSSLAGVGTEHPGAEDPNPYPDPIPRSPTKMFRSAAGSAWAGSTCGRPTSRPSASSCTDKYSRSGPPPLPLVNGQTLPRPGTPFWRTSGGRARPASISAFDWRRLAALATMAAFAPKSGDAVENFRMPPPPGPRGGDDNLTGSLPFPRISENRGSPPPSHSPPSHSGRLPHALCIQRDGEEVRYRGGPTALPSRWWGKSEWRGSAGSSVGKPGRKPEAFALGDGSLHKPVQLTQHTSPHPLIQ